MSDQEPRKSADQPEKRGNDRQYNVVPSRRIGAYQKREIGKAECDRNDATDDGDDAADFHVSPFLKLIPRSEVINRERSQYSLFLLSISTLSLS